MEKEIKIPIVEGELLKYDIGDKIVISGMIYCARDAVLPKVVELVKMGRLGEDFPGIDFCGSVIFHTAVSPAGVGPTSSNKLEIESSMVPLSREGVKIHLGKGKISRETIDGLNKYGSVYAIIPPITALLGDKTIEKEAVAFSELGMEALYRLKVDRYPAIVAAAHGRSIYG